MAESLRYAHYLAGPTWRRIRRAAFDFHGRSCFRCHKRLRLRWAHLHHQRYGKWTYEDWKKDKESVIPVCKSCHADIHGIDLAGISAFGTVAEQFHQRLEREP